MHLKRMRLVETSITKIPNLYTLRPIATTIAGQRTMHQKRQSTKGNKRILTNKHRSANLNPTKKTWVQEEQRREPKSQHYHNSENIKEIIKRTLSEFSLHLQLFNPCIQNPNKNDPYYKHNIKHLRNRTNQNQTLTMKQTRNVPL